MRSGGDADLVRFLSAIAAQANLADDRITAVTEALAAIGAFTGAVVGQAWEPDAWGSLSLVACWQDDSIEGEGFVAASRSVSLSVGRGLPGKVLAATRPGWIADVQRDTTFARAEAARACGLRAAFAFPVTTGSTVAAVLEVFGTEPLPADETFLAAMGQVGTHLGRVYERAAATAAVDDAVRRRKQILDTAADAFIEMAGTGEVRAWNAQAEKVFGFTAEAAIGHRVAELIVPARDRQAHEAGLQRFLTTGRPHLVGRTLELSALHRDGYEFPVELTLWSLREADGWSFYSFARDITVRKKEQARLAHVAMHDSLTGLANRAHLGAGLSDALAAMARGGPVPSVYFVDLDGFKPINDGFGHDVGDQVLVAVARRLRESTRPDDVVGRLAGDEFVVITCCADTAEARMIGERIVAVLGDPIAVDGRMIGLSASVGYASAHPDSTAETLLAEADAAMYRVKRSGRGRAAAFDDALPRHHGDAFSLPSSPNGAVGERGRPPVAGPPETAPPSRNGSSDTASIPERSPQTTRPGPDSADPSEPSDAPAQPRATRRHSRRRRLVRLPWG